MRPTNGGFMDFTITLSRDERFTIMRGIWDQEYKINSELSELYGMDSEFAKLDIAKLEEKRKQLRILAIKIEG
jgi:hypothetical protein